MLIVRSSMLSLAILGCTGDVGNSPGRPGAPLDGTASGGSQGAGGDAGQPGVPGRGGASSTTTPDGSVGVIGRPVGPSAGRRLTKSEYLNTVGDILGVTLSDEEKNLLPEDQPATGGGFRNDIQGLLPTALRTDAYEALATHVSEKVAWTGGLAGYATCTDPTPACRSEFVRRLGRLVYRRPPTEGDVQNLTPLFALTASDAAGFQAGGRLILEAMLQSPHFLYRLERLDNIDPVSQKPRPTAFELATRLSYLAWLSAPTSELLDTAERGELSSDASFATTLTRMMTDPRARRGFEGYAQDWLQLYRLDTRTPNEGKGVSQALLAEMKAETLRFAARIALTESRDLSALLTDRKTEIGPTLAQVYGVPAPAQGVATFDLSSDRHRVGILTQPGFLILRAAPERATIVHRGLMVLRVFLCSEVPPPPPDAATKIDSVPTNLTDRERFGLHTTSPSCKACHSAFDPLGYPFEPYDLSGKWRAADEFGNALQSDGQANIDGAPQPYKDTLEFATLLSASPTVQRCLVTKMFQYALGRSLGPDDEQAVDDLAKRFEAGGRTYVAGITSVTTSAAFHAPAPSP